MRRLFFCVLFVFATPSFAALNSNPNNVRIPLTFEPNRGQVPADVTFVSNGFRYKFELTLDGARFLLKNDDSVSRISMRTVGSASNATAKGKGTLNRTSNYLIGPESGWIRDVPNYSSVEYSSVYPNIDVTYYGTDGILEYDFTIKPGGDPNRIRLRFEGADSVRVDRDGDLILTLGNSSIRQKRPATYQQIGGKNVSVESTYVVNGKEVSFRLGKYDKEYPVTIDPVLLYASYWGTWWGDTPGGIAVDSTGALYAVGSVLWDMAQLQYDGRLIKIGLNGSGYDITFGSGWQDDIATAVAVNGAGEAYVTGSSVADRPNSMQLQNTLGPPAGGTDPFIIKFNSAGNGFVFSSYFGGSGLDSATAIDLDSSGNIYIGGSTNSANFPIVSASNPVLRGGSDGFLVKINSTGTSIGFSTYVGGSGHLDTVSAVRLDGSGNVAVVGSSDSPDLFNSPIRPFAGGDRDAFAAKFNSLNGSLIAGTYLGGTNHEYGRGVDTDSAGGVYVAGETCSSDFPVSANGYQRQLLGACDGFVVKLDSSLRITYASLLGGMAPSTGDSAYGVRVDSSGAMYVAGYTDSDDFPLMDSLSRAGGLYVTKFSPSGQSLVYSTRIASTAGANGIALDPSGNAVVLGDTSSLSLPTTAGAFQTQPPLNCISFTYTENSVLLRISDAATASQQPSYTLIEQNDPAVQYTGTWNTNSSPYSRHTQKLAVLSVGQGNRATVTFTGVGITWLGVKDAYAGIANIYVDGQLLGEVDTYSAADTFQYPLFSIDGLTNAAHTLAIEVSGRKNASSQGAWIWVDAFVIQRTGSISSGSKQGFVRNAIAPATLYSPNSGYPGPTELDFPFTGAGIRFVANAHAIGFCGNPTDSAVRTVVDGVDVPYTIVDFDVSGSKIYAVSGLASGSHTLKITLVAHPNLGPTVGTVTAVDKEISGGSSTGGNPPPTGGGFTRVEQTNSAVTFTGSWSTNTNIVHSGGSAALSIDIGARATFTFNGTAAKWIGFKDPYSGIAKVYVDGVLQTQVDTYSLSQQAQVAMYTTATLASGTHTLAVEVTGAKNASATSSWVWVDAFESNGTAGGGGGTPPPPPPPPGGGTFTRVEQTNPAVAVTGNWYNNANSVHSGGSAILSIDSGSRATFTFNGTVGRWIGFKDPYSGIARVYVDGTLQAQVDTYSASQEAQVVLYTTATLSAGTHTVAIEVTGTKNASSSSSWVWVDAFESSGTGGGGTPPPPPPPSGGTYTRVEQTSPAVTFTKTWYANTNSGHSGGSAVLALDVGARAIFTFTGTAVKWIGHMDAYSGIAKVYVDGVLQTQVDTYSSNDQYQVTLFTMTGLAAGSHTITVEVSGTKNASSSASWIWVDAFEYLP